jgi:hypothetical protein
VLLALKLHIIPIYSTEYLTDDVKFEENNREHTQDEFPTRFYMFLFFS